MVRTQNILFPTGLYFVLGTCLENGEMTPFPKKDGKGLKRCKTKHLRIKFHCTSRMPSNDIEEDEIDRMLQNVAFKWSHEMCEDVHE